MERWRLSKPHSFVEKTGLLAPDLDKWARLSAVHNLRKMDLQTFLRRWWVEKYKLPWTHECAQESTLEDLLVEYYEDYFHKHPEEARKELAVEGEFTFDETGDALLNKWEAELARGVTPDLEEGLSPAERQKLKHERERAQQGRNDMRKLGLIQDDYTKEDARYASKMVAVGSPEEAELMRSRLLGNGKNVDATALFNKLLR